MAKSNKKPNVKRIGFAKFIVSSRPVFKTSDTISDLNQCTLSIMRAVGDICYAVNQKIVEEESLNVTDLKVFIGEIVHYTGMAVYTIFHDESSDIPIKYKSGIMKEMEGLCDKNIDYDLSITEMCFALINVCNSLITGLQNKDTQAVFDSLNGMLINCNSMSCRIHSDVRAVMYHTLNNYYKKEYKERYKQYEKDKESISKDVSFFKLKETVSKKEEDSH